MSNKYAHILDNELRYIVLKLREKIQFYYNADSKMSLKSDILTSEFPRRFLEIL